MKVRNQLSFAPQESGLDSACSRGVSVQSIRQSLLKTYPVVGVIHNVD
jgi:hypothetical protein